MQRMGSVLLLFFAVSVPAIAEEISMKDGTKIVGHMTVLTADKIEVETAYGKMQLKRSDILSIRFPENMPSNGSGATPAKSDAPNIDESLNGTQYTNRTAQFSLTLPPDWIIDTQLHRSPETLAWLSSSDKLNWVGASRQEGPLTLEAYKEVVELTFQKTLPSYEKVSESSVTIDGKVALLISYRMTPPKYNNLHIQYLTAIIKSGNTYTMLMAWCAESRFPGMRPILEQILTSYRSTGPMTAAAPSSKP
jgi:hypothetical protein